MYRNLKNRLQNNLFFKDTAKLVVATTVAQAITILASPFLTRIYSPEEYGILAAYTSILNIIVVASSFRYEMAIPLPPKEEDAENLLLSSVGLNLIFALISILGVIIFRNKLTSILNAPNLSKYLWMLPFGVLFYGTYKCFNYWAVRNKRFDLVSKSKVVQSLSSIFTQIASGLMGLGASGLIVGQVTGQSAGFTLLAKGLKIKTALKNFYTKRKAIIKTLKEYKNFPIYDTPAALLNVISIELPQIMLLSLFSPTIAGLYLLSQKVLGVPLRIIGQSISQVLYGNIKEQISNGTLAKTTGRIVLLLFSIVILPGVLVFFWGAPIFNTVFGSNWYEAGRYASVLIISISAQFLYSPVSLVLIATKGQIINLLIQATMVIFRTIAIYIGFINNSPYLSIVYFTLASASIYCIGILIVVFRTRKVVSASSLRD